jgi:alpha-tubulin suppressor-like RCC1 family protein
MLNSKLHLLYVSALSPMEVHMKNTRYTHFSFIVVTILVLIFSFTLEGCSGGGGSSDTGTTSSDKTPPKIVSTAPANKATGVAINSIFSATFSEVMDPASFSSANFYINGVPATISSKCSSAFLFPTSDLTPSTSYIVTIAGVTDSAGNAMTTPYSGTFNTGSSAPVLAIAAGFAHTMIVKSDGTLWAWGNNSYGQLGDGTLISKTSPTQIGTAVNWSKVAGSQPYTLGLRSDGTLWTWGDTMSTVTSPVQIGTSAQFSAIAMNSAAFYPSNAGLKSDGTLWTWGGDNSSGQLGNGTTGNGSSNATGTPAQIGSATNWSAVSAGTLHRMALRSDGTLWAWGSNSHGQLGDGTLISKNSPTRIGSATNWSAVSAGGGHTIALKSDGTLWAWGLNTFGQLGDGTTANRSTPTQIGSAANWSAVSAGSSHTIALRSDGTLWAWGVNSSGQLGDGTTVDKTSPTQIGTATNWSSTAAGDSHNVALRSDGTLWAWGLNTYGQLGDGTTTNRTAPVQVNFGSAMVPSAPSGVTATAGTAQITVSWSNVSYATSYDIYYSTSSPVSTTNGTKIACVTSPFTGTGLLTGTTYYIIVVASNGYGDSAASSTASATTPVTTVTPPGTGGGTYYWANWNCTSSQCASVMGATSGSTGQFCSLADCTACNAKGCIGIYGATCSTTATSTKRTVSASNGVCLQSGVDF